MTGWKYCKSSLQVFIDTKITNVKKNIKALPSNHLSENRWAQSGDRPAHQNDLITQCGFSPVPFKNNKLFKKFLIIVWEKIHYIRKKISHLTMIEVCVYLTSTFWVSLTTLILQIWSVVIVYFVILLWRAYLSKRLNECWESYYFKKQIKYFEHY